LFPPGRDTLHVSVESSVSTGYPREKVEIICPDRQEFQCHQRHSEGCMREAIAQLISDSVESIPLPPVPQVLIRLIALLDDDRTPVPDVASLVALDPAVAAHLLSVANAPPFRKEPAPFGLEPCLAAIGLRMMRTLATSMAVQSVFAPRIDKRNFDYTGFWSHSVRVAELARSLAIAVDYPDADEAYLAGLLHDIGQLILAVGISRGYGYPGGMPSREAGPADNRNAFDATTHAEVGSRLVGKWNLPSFMADAVLFHRRPVEDIASADLLSRIVWSAHHLSYCDTPENAPHFLLSDIAAIPSLVGIDSAGISEACRQSRYRVAELAASVGIDLSHAGEISPGSSFIAHELLFQRRHDNDVARLQLEAQVRTMAVMQPLQQGLLSMPDVALLYGALRESARMLFGLGRPVFLVVHPDKPILTGADVAGQSPLLTRLEIRLDSRQCLAASALRENRPCSSFDENYPRTPFLIDTQICRILHTAGILCVPMHGGARPVGVMVYGLTAGRCPHTRGYRDWMAGFSSMAAKTLEAFSRLRDQSQETAAELTRNYEQRARKVVHEVVNPLGIINNYLKIVSQKLGDNAGVGRELEILREEIARVERIIRKLSGQTEHPPPGETVNVNSVIEGMLALYGESLFETNGIVIDRYLTPDPPIARADRDSLKQILLNLWKNSSEAMPDGGRFCITTRVTAEGKERSLVEIHLSDSGPGIPPDVIACLFQPLDPDRRPAHSGVGLSIVASLVERLCGTISCQSLPGKGTEFTIRLPQPIKDTL